MKLVSHTEGSIQKLLNYRYSTTARYKLCNAFIFRDNWESDFFIVQKASGYSYEIEIKISRADLFADRRKRSKHSVLKSGQYIKQASAWYCEIDSRMEKILEYDYLVEHKFRPNKFYYCVPDGMINAGDIPDYAGLMFVRDNDIKRCPLCRRSFS